LGAPTRPVRATRGSRAKTPAARQSEPTRILRRAPKTAKKLRVPAPTSQKTGPAFGATGGSLVSPRSLKEDTMSADEAQKSLKQELKEVQNDLQQMADEIRVKLHLAGMDAKSAWDDLQPKLLEFEQRIDARADEVGDEVKALGQDIKDRLLNIKAKLVD